MSTMLLNAMDSPLEALAVDYLTFGFLTVVNSLWPWIAVITAAVSFWRFKAVSEPPANLLPPTPQSPPLTTPLPVEQTSVRSKTFVSEMTSLSDNNPLNGVIKGMKFTLYYMEEVGEAAEEEEEEAEAAAEAEEVVGEWWKRWEEALGTRRGEKGWYRYQDLTELNGNVVRLWDETQIW